MDNWQLRNELIAHYRQRTCISTIGDILELIHCKMEIEYYSAEELRKIYFDVTGKDARDENGQYDQDYCEWLENLHCEGEVYSKNKYRNT